MTVSRQSVDAICKILIVFLSSLLFLSIVNGGTTLVMVIGALATTYIFIHYWERRYNRQNVKSEIKCQKNG